MNCLNHPDVAAAAYCQTCGKPLCTGCMRSVGGVVYCEPCLTARLSPPAAGTPYAAPGSAAWHPHPVLAGLLGFIPGVGAMYNGQYVKALAHVLIFAVFVSLSDHSSIFGLFVAAWVFYQVFDAAQTAIARRDGTPLPNPFGLNDLASRLGMPPTPPVEGRRRLWGRSSWGCRCRCARAGAAWASAAPARPRSNAATPAPGPPSRRPGAGSRNTSSPVRWWSSTAGLGWRASAKGEGRRDEAR